MLMKTDSNLKELIDELTEYEKKGLTLKDAIANYTNVIDARKEQEAEKRRLRKEAIAEAREHKYYKITHNGTSWKYLKVLEFSEQMNRAKCETIGVTIDTRFGNSRVITYDPKEDIMPNWILGLNSWTKAEKITKELYEQKLEESSDLIEKISAF